jgi:PIN domain nuclease of toxin-antitoxin system
VTFPLLLDTHALIWLMEGTTRLSRRARQLAETAAKDGMLRVSTISLWEIATLESKGRISFDRDCQTWINEMLASPGLHPVPLTPEIAVQSTRLPGMLHGDPADRILIATARVLGATLLTADAKILAYAKAGYLSVARAS